MSPVAELAVRVVRLGREGRDRRQELRDALAVTLAMFGAIELLVRAAYFIRNSNASFAPSFSLF